MSSTSQEAVTNSKDTPTIIPGDDEAPKSTIKLLYNIGNLLSSKWLLPCNKYIRAVYKLEKGGGFYYRITERYDTAESASTAMCLSAHHLAKIYVNIEAMARMDKKHPQIFHIPYSTNSSNIHIVMQIIEESYQDFISIYITQINEESKPTERGFKIRVSQINILKNVLRTALSYYKLKDEINGSINMGYKIILKNIELEAIDQPKKWFNTVDLKSFDEAQRVIQFLDEFPEEKFIAQWNEYYIKNPNDAGKSCLPHTVYRQIQGHYAFREYLKELWLKPWRRNL